MKSAPRETLVLMRAAAKVRDGRWFTGAPSHVLGELVAQLNEDGFELVRIDTAKPVSQSEGTK